MTKNGQEVDTQVLDAEGSIVEIVDTLRDYELTTRFKRYTVRIRVQNDQDEMTQYLIFTELIRKKKDGGTLFIRDRDASTQPSFGYEYRKNMPDGYFVIQRYCEAVL